MRSPFTAMSYFVFLLFFYNALNDKRSYNALNDKRSSRTKDCDIVGWQLRLHFDLVISSIKLIMFKLLTKPKEKNCKFCAQKKDVGQLHAKMMTTNESKWNMIALFLV